MQLQFNWNWNWNWKFELQSGAIQFLQPLVTSVNSYLDHSNDKSMELNVQRSIDTTQSLEQVLRGDHVHQDKQEWSEEKNVSTDGWRFQGKQRKTI